MARFFLSKQEIDFAAGTIPIRGADAHHIAYSLRMAVGERLTVCDMQKTEYLCEIIRITPDEVTLRIEETRDNDTELPTAVHLYQSVPKGDKMDYIVQKAVELGVSSITPVMSARCIVKLDQKSAQNKCARWQKIAEEAAKQCGRGFVPKVSEPVAFRQAVTQGAEDELSIFCYEGDGTESLKTILSDAENGKMPAGISFFIGPEGGYDTAEVQCAKDAGMRIANLGKRILRCETASGFVLSAMTYALEL